MNEGGREVDFMPDPRPLVRKNITSYIIKIDGFQY